MSEAQINSNLIRPPEVIASDPGRELTSPRKPGLKTQIAVRLLGVAALASTVGASGNSGLPAITISRDELFTTSQYAETFKGKEYKKGKTASFRK